LDPRGAIINHYSNQAGCWGASCNATDNNGNLRRQEVYIPRPDSTDWDKFAQFYEYDALNRLQSVRENENGRAVQWQQQYVYDRYGNRTIDQDVSRTYGAGINKKNFTVNTANNRLSVPSGQTGTMTYDAAGNLSNDTYTGGGSRTYDAENRMISAPGDDGASTYTYDGDGHRVRRYVGGEETATWQIYGITGELLAEYNGVDNDPSSLRKEYGYRNGQLLITVEPPLRGVWCDHCVDGGTSQGHDAVILWLVTDQLGTPRMIFDKTGSLAGVKRHDYLPFGEEIFADSGGRTTAMGYTGATDRVRQKFTDKERDAETGLDYFLARYYSSTQGRFTSPDEFSGGPDELYEAIAAGNPTFYADLADPQSLNKYQYAYNNPLRYVDPDGHQGKGLVNEALKTEGQIVKDTVVGTTKELANVVIDTSNAINTVLDAVSGPFAMKFGQIERFEASTPGERGAMIGVDISLLTEGGLSASRTGAAMVNGRRVAAMTEEMRAAKAPAATGAAETTIATTQYTRPSGATTAAQRASVQGKPCSVCGESAPRMNAGHREALVKEHYRTGTIDKTRMRSLGAVRSECPTCSNREGAALSRYSKAMKNQIPQ
jgi:RHS repeat-associated protein